jgi:hypothetical protein
MSRLANRCFRIPQLLFRRPCVWDEHHRCLRFRRCGIVDSENRSNEDTIGITGGLQTSQFRLG